MPSGYAPVGSYQSSGSIAEGFFDESEDELRHRRIQENMGFLYSLIYSKLNYHNNMRISKKEGLKTSLRASDSDEEKDEESGVSQHQDHLEDGHNLDINMVEDLLSIQPKGRDLDEHRLAEVCLLNPQLPIDFLIVSDFFWWLLRFLTLFAQWSRSLVTDVIMAFRCSMR